MPGARAQVVHFLHPERVYYSTVVKDCQFQDWRFERDQHSLTIEFKINYFKPATGDSIVCRARVINGGRRIIASESDLFSISNGGEKHVAGAMVTLRVTEQGVRSKELGVPGCMAACLSGG